MAIITVDDAIDELNITDPADMSAELVRYVDAVNQWVATRVSDTTPAYVKIATLLLLDHLWSSQRGPGGGPLAVDDESVTVAGVGYAIPNRVKELLEPVRIKTSAMSSFPAAMSWPDSVEWPSP